MLSVPLAEAPFEHRSVSFPHQSDGTGRNLRPRTAGSGLATMGKHSIAANSREGRLQSG
jgi:hypothetical protein